MGQDMGSLGEEWQRKRFKAEERGRDRKQMLQLLSLLSLHAGFSFLLPWKSPNPHHILSNPGSHLAPIEM